MIVEEEKIYQIIEIAIKAGLEILTYYNIPELDVKYKQDSSPLTMADTASHNIIVEALEKISNYPVLSEESATVPFADRCDWVEFWLVDPLDGTKEFINKNGEFTVNIALIAANKVVFGVVYVPVLDSLYVGKDDGAYKLENASQVLAKVKDSNEFWAECKKIHVLEKIDCPLKVVASKSHCNSETDNFIKSLKKHYSEIEKVSCGSSLKLCMVAEGKANIYPRLAPTMEWDTAAAHAVVNAAGGSVKDFHTKQELSYNKDSLLNPYFIVKDKITIC